ncbi:MAG: TonB-dependent siderophore receptor [Pseudomonadota bacterium]
MTRSFTPMAAAILAAFASPLAVQPVFAQATPATTTLPEVLVSGSADKSYAPDLTTVGGKEAIAVRDVPQTVNVVNRAVLEAQAANSMTEALRNVPGITISAGEGGAIGDNINLRGFSSRTDVFRDGFRDRGQYSRDTFNIEAVEVLKGPSSMLFGRGSTGGVINQVSKKPSLKSGTEATATVGTDDYYRATLDVNRKLSDTSAVRLNAFGQDLKSTRDVVRNQDFGIAPSLRLGMGTPTELTLSALIQRNDDLPDYGFPILTSDGLGTVRKPVDAPANAYYGYLDDHFKQAVNMANASLRHKFSPTLTLRTQLQVSNSKTEAAPSPLTSSSVRRTTEPVALPGNPASLRDPLASLIASREDRDRDFTDKSIFSQTDLIAKIKSGAMLHTVTTGLELGRDEYREQRYVWNTTTAQREINLGNPVNGTRQGTRALTRTVETTADTLGLYVNDQIDLNKQWKVVGGLRWDRFKVSSGLTRATLPAGYPADTTVASAPHSDSMLSQRAGVIFQPTEMQSYYLSYGTSFNPSAETVTQSATTAALDPEKNRAYELGAKIDVMDGNLSFNGALFSVSKDNARTTDAVTRITTLDGDVRVRGIEVGVVGRITPAWQVLAGYTLLDSEIVTSLDVGTGLDAGIRSQGKTLQNTPRHNASLWTTFSFLQNWEAGGGLVYASERFVNNFETAVVDGYTRVDASLAFKQPNYDLRFNLQNATDKKYYEVASGGRATPVKGRGVLVTLAYRF